MEQFHYRQLCFDLDYAQTPEEKNRGEAVEVYRRHVRRLNENYTVRTPFDAAMYLTNHVFNPFEAFDQEELWALLLKRKNVITHDVMIYRGQIDAIYIRLAEVFRPCIQYAAAGVILAHCHPSGDPEPSPEDCRVSQAAVTWGRQLDIDVLDHIIIGAKGFVSLKTKGVLDP